MASATWNGRVERWLGKAGAWLAAVAIAAGSNVAGAATFSGLVIFGDSLSDTGNVLALTTFLSQLQPPPIPGLTPIPPQPPYLLGRFSNGPVWVETLAVRTGYDTAAAPAGLSLGPAFNNATLPGLGGNNYAIAGALTGAGGSFGVFIPTGLAAQVGYYLGQHGGAADPDALYVVLAGGNDGRSATAEPNKALRDVALQAAAQNYRAAAATLADAGARTILIGNLPDLGRTPEARYLNHNPARASDVTRVFNRALDKAFAGFAAEKQVTLARVDLYALVEAVVHDATDEGGERFGITNVDLPCLDVSVVFPEIVIPGAGTVSCDTALWADDHHPTARAHRLLGNAAAACRLGDDGTIGLTKFAAADDAERLGRFCRVSAGKDAVR